MAVLFSSWREGHEHGRRGRSPGSQALCPTLPPRPKAKTASVGKRLSHTTFPPDLRQWSRLSQRI